MEVEYINMYILERIWIFSKKERREWFRPLFTLKKYQLVIYVAAKDTRAETIQ